MTSNKPKYFYVYRIDFSDGTFYFGSRKSKVPPEEDLDYWGSPVTHKEKWKRQDLFRKKKIIFEFDSEEKCYELEQLLIKLTWNDLSSLNENCAGVVSYDASEKGWNKTTRTYEHQSRAGKERAKVTKRKVIFISPDGTKYQVIGIRPFCEKHQLNRGNIHKVLCGKIKHHKGWKASYIDESV